jgi:hypothetical protein
LGWENSHPRPLPPGQGQIDYDYDDDDEDDPASPGCFRRRSELWRTGRRGNHAAPIQFVTIAHELAHLFLGHLRPDKPLNIPERPRPDHTQAELEAESVAYLACSRNGVESKSQAYLTNYVDKNTTIKALDLYQVMRAAGQIESLLGLTFHTRYEPQQRNAR